MFNRLKKQQRTTPPPTFVLFAYTSRTTGKRMFSIDRPENMTEEQTQLLQNFRVVYTGSFIACMQVRLKVCTSFKHAIYPTLEKEYLQSIFN